jgi:hypothetical protein
MARIARERERTATQEEIAEDRRRCQESKPHIFPTVGDFERFAAEPTDARQALLDALDGATALLLVGRP